MNPYYEREGITIYHGGCMRTLAGLAARSAHVRFSTIITDPPYGLKFMGKQWDHGVPGEMFWKRFAMLSLPGAMLLAFGGTRTWHRLAVAIEDAGWEIRDTLMWVYGSGFPKSHDISKAIDKRAGAEREVVDMKPNLPGLHRSRSTANHFTDDAWQGSDNAARAITAPTTPAAQLWDGYGTALKPAWEPIILAMNPLNGAFANNALKHGVAGINVDGGRITTEVLPSERRTSKPGGGRGGMFMPNGDAPAGERHNPKGRWPANLILDGSPSVLEGFPQSRSSKVGLRERDGSTNIYGGNALLSSRTMHTGKYGDSGSAARFFYCAKASRGERNRGCESLYWRRDKKGLVRVTEEEWESLDAKKRAVGNIHPTVKPLSLMEYLCKLTKMPTEADLVLDPFMGSGSTLVACIRTGRAAVGIDNDEAACEIAAKRVEEALSIRAANDLDKQGEIR